MRTCMKALAVRSVLCLGAVELRTPVASGNLDHGPWGRNIAVEIVGVTHVRNPVATMSLDSRTTNTITARRYTECLPPSSWTR
jgi:hypothetical protein